MNKNRRISNSGLAMIVACGAALAMMLPAQSALAAGRHGGGHSSRGGHSSSHYGSHSSGYRGHSGYSSRSNVGFSVYVGSGGYSRYRGSYSNYCAPRYSSYSYGYPRYRYYASTPSYRYECYTPGVNTYYNNYSYNTYTVPTAPGTATYRVWQQELATPVGQVAEPEAGYPSYNPGPAQPSPAPVAQLEREGAWTTISPAQQQQNIERGVTKAERPRQVTIGSVPAQRGSTPDEAWGLMGEGEYTKARAAFASLTQTMPTSDDMKLGFGLANALDGRDSAAAWSLRRAVDGGVDLAAAGKHLAGMEDELESMAIRLAERADEAKTADSWFVLGVVQMIRGERDAAGLAVLQGLETGDRSDAMMRLADELGIETPSDGDA